MTQEELGKAIGFHSQTAVQYIECGKTRLRVAELMRIASVLHVSPAVLLGNTEYAKKESVDIASRRIVSYEGVPLNRGLFFVPHVNPSAA